MSNRPSNTLNSNSSSSRGSNGNGLGDGGMMSMLFRAAQASAEGGANDGAGLADRSSHAPLKKRAYHEYHESSRSSGAAGGGEGVEGVEGVEGADIKQKNMGGGSRSSFLRDDSFCSESYSSRSTNSNNYDYGYDGGSSDTSTPSQSEMDDKKQKSNPPDHASQSLKRKKSSKKRRSSKQSSQSSSYEDSSQSSFSDKKPRASKSPKTHPDVPTKETHKASSSTRKVRFVSCSSNSSSQSAIKPEELAAETLAAMGSMSPMGARAAAMEAMEMADARNEGEGGNDDSRKDIQLSKMYRGDSMISSLSSDGPSAAAGPKAESVARKPSPPVDAERGGEEKQVRPAPWYCYVDHSRPAYSLDRPPSPLVQPCFVPSFPMKLHCILLHEEYKECIKFLPHGRSWRITDPYMFEELVLPVYFGPTKMSSFLRQVNVWGFKRMTKGRNKNSYYNELFLRGHPQLCKGMRPTRNQGTALSSSEAKKSSRACQAQLEPDLFEIEKLSPLPEDNATDMKCLRAIHELIAREGPKAKMPLDIYIGGVEGHHVANQMAAKRSAKGSLECDDARGAVEAPPMKKARLTPSNEAALSEEHKEEFNDTNNYDLDAGPPRKVSLQDFSTRVSSLVTSSTTSFTTHATSATNRQLPQDRQNSVFPTFTSAAAQMGQSNVGPIPNQDAQQLLKSLMKSTQGSPNSSHGKAAVEQNNRFGGPPIRQGFPMSSSPPGLSLNGPSGVPQALLLEHLRRQQQQPIPNNSIGAFAASNLGSFGNQNMNQPASVARSDQQPNASSAAAQSAASQANIYASALFAARSMQSNNNASPVQFPNQMFPLPQNNGSNASRGHESQLALAESIIQNNQQKANGIVESLIQSFRQKEAASAAASSSQTNNPNVPSNAFAAMNPDQQGQNNSFPNQGPLAQNQEPQARQSRITPEVLQNMISWAVKEGAKFGAQHYLANQHNRRR